MLAPRMYLDETRTALLSSVEGFVEREISPLAFEADEHPEENDILKILPGAGESGLLDALLPEERGGQGMDPFTFLLVTAELAAASAAAAVLLLGHNLALLALELSGVGNDTASGEGRPLHCLATGTRLRGPAGELGGRCDFVPGLLQAERLVVVGEEGRVALISLPCLGVRTGYLFDHGLRAARPAELLLKSVSPQSEGRLEGEGLERLEALLEMGAAAACAGIICASLSAAAEYAGRRYQGGDIIGEPQQVRLMLGEMEASREVAFALLAGAAGFGGGDPGSRAARAVRRFLAERALGCACDAVQLHGGYGYMREQGVERLMRDASCLQAWPAPSRQLLLGLRDMTGA